MAYRDIANNPQSRDATVIDPNFLLSMYAQGVFPMAHDDGEIYWYNPDPRAILPLDTFHIPRRLRRTAKKQPYDIVIDRDFRGTMLACAEPAPGRESTWINETILESYCLLNQYGYAHSVEVYDGARLVGGLYGVSLRGLFAGESMFSRATDASKLALVALVEHMKRRGFGLLDVQFQTDHLTQFGVIEIAQDEYRNRLNEALTLDVSF